MTTEMGTTAMVSWGPEELPYAFGKPTNEAVLEGVDPATRYPLTCGHETCPSGDLGWVDDLHEYTWTTGSVTLICRVFCPQAAGAAAKVRWSELRIRAVYEGGVLTRFDAAKH